MRTGFFHGWKYTKALHDYQLIGGKAIMVPKFAMGVWWSRWCEYSNGCLPSIFLDPVADATVGCQQTT